MSQRLPEPAGVWQVRERDRDGHGRVLGTGRPIDKPVWTNIEKKPRNLPFMGCLPAMRSVMQMASLPVNATAADEPRNRASKWRTPGDALSFGPGRADTVGSRDTPARGRAWTSPRILHLIADEVTPPRTDATPGGAPYRIPFQLSRSRTRMWIDLFIKAWTGHPDMTPDTIARRNSRRSCQASDLPDLLYCSNRRAICSSGRLGSAP